jgi:hypothetical protein
MKRQAATAAAAAAAAVAEVEEGGISLGEWGRQPKSAEGFQLQVQSSS